MVFLNEQDRKEHVETLYEKVDLITTGFIELALSITACSIERMTRVEIKNYWLLAPCTLVWPVTRRGIVRAGG